MCPCWPEAAPLAKSPLPVATTPMHWAAWAVTRSLRLWSRRRPLIELEPRRLCRACSTGSPTSVGATTTPPCVGKRERPRRGERDELEFLMFIYGTLCESNGSRLIENIQQQGHIAISGQHSAGPLTLSVNVGFLLILLY